VNPTIAEVDGERSYPSLASLPEAVDIVDVFRNAVYLDEVADEAIAAGATSAPCSGRQSAPTPVPSTMPIGQKAAASPRCP